MPNAVLLGAILSVFGSGFGARMKQGFYNYRQDGILTGVKTVLPEVTGKHNVRQPRQLKLLMRACACQKNRSEPE